MIRSNVSRPSRPAPSYGRVILASGDDTYILRFAEALCNSIARHSRSICSVHFHAINPSDETLSLLERLSARKDLTIIYSTENTDLSELTDKQHKVYYACARFLRLPDMLAHYGSPILVLDLDQMVVAPLLRAFSDADVSMIRYRQGDWNILSMFSASVVRISNTSAGRAFANRVREYLCARIAEGTIDWHLDQAALAVVFLTSPNKHGFHFHQQNIMHSGPDMERLPPETVFWSITFSIPSFASKLESDRFKSLVA